MEISELKSLMVSSLDSNSDPKEASRLLEEAGVSYSFGAGFQDKVLERIASTGSDGKWSRSATRIIFLPYFPFRCCGNSVC